MNNRANSDDRFVFFLNFFDRLPPQFFHLAAALNELHIKLIPGHARQLSDLSTNKKMVVVSIENDLMSRAGIKRAMDGSLGLNLRLKRISFVHISSFEKNSALISLEKTNHYNFIRLPLEYHEIAKSIALKVVESRASINRWPGGRRAKLPT
ncbi:MAG: hypothetical protein ACPGJV_04095 [Bacteriovoracaceae bacterium]